WAAMVGGGLMALYGLTRCDRSGLLLALMGGGIAFQGYRGDLSMVQNMRLERDFTANGDPSASALRWQQTIQCREPIENIYRVWRRLENLPRLIDHLDSVLPLGGNRFRWVVRTPAGVLEWDTKLVEERRDRLVAWQSAPGSAVESAGVMEFDSAPGSSATELHVALSYLPPEGPLREMFERFTHASHRRAPSSMGAGVWDTGNAA
ncbi:MAG TPA: SRPBCC family protein, partial [Thermoanaerobaculia bacterium]